MSKSEANEASESDDSSNSSAYSKEERKETNNSDHFIAEKITGLQKHEETKNVGQEIIKDLTLIHKITPSDGRFTEL